MDKTRPCAESVCPNEGCVLPYQHAAGHSLQLPQHADYGCRHNGGIRHAAEAGHFESYCECGWQSGLTTEPMAAALVLTDHQIAQIDGSEGA